MAELCWVEETDIFAAEQVIQSQCLYKLQKNNYR